MYDDIIIKDLTMGQSWRFTAVRSGYAEAYAKIQEIIQKGHAVGGDVARVRSVMGG